MTTLPAVTALLERVAGTFVAPRAGHEAARVPDSGCAAARARAVVAPAVAVLAKRDHVLAAGGAVALAVADECRAPVAIVCVWTGDEPSRSRGAAPASARAHRHAQALARRGHAARASRRLVPVRLPADEREAEAEAGRVGAACGAAPLVLALAGARDGGLDDVLRACDVVVVAAAPGAAPALVALAEAGVEALGVKSVACELPGSPFGRLLAANGAGLAPSLRGALRPVSEALR